MSDSVGPDTSLSALLATLAPTAIIAGVYVAIFLILRKSQRRFYAPRTYLGSLREQERTPELPKGLFNWVGAFWKIPDTYALQHQSLDSYLFLRYLRILAGLMFVGCIITWPVLFPVNATGGGGQQGLNILSITNVNVAETTPRYRLFAHVLIGWIYFGFILFLVARETIFYINLRQAFLLSPVYANRLSSRTVLFTSVPQTYLDEAKLRKMFGDSVKNIWVICETKQVDEIVEKRDKIAYKLESAETKLIKLANGARLKAQKAGGNRAEANREADAADAEPGSVAARWIPRKKRPTHRTGKWGLVGPKVDSIDWCREQLEHVIPEADVAQEAYRNREFKAHGAVFIEFYNQVDAEAAYQSLAHHWALHMTPRYIGVNPNEVVWKSLKISWWQKVVRRWLVTGFIAALIIFWAIPVAVVGAISNVSYLETISFLTWLSKIPTWIMGVVTGLLPSIALSILMSLVPIVMRLCAKLAGEPTLARVELFTQNAYFAFQVIQVFLVVTLGSGAASVGKQIAQDPSSVLSLLLNNLPKASNFYISYFILQGLTIASNILAQVVGFILFNLFYKFFTSTPRAMYKKWTNLSAISWGSVVPVYSNIAVIAITYAMIAPLDMAFAAIGIFLFYLAFRYNVLFVTDSAIDTKGLFYPRALRHILTGVYIGQVYLVALFVFSKSWGPIVLQVVFLVFTILFHISMNAALNPLLHTLPKSLVVEEELLRAESGAHHEKLQKNGNGSAVLDTTPHKKPNFVTKFLKPHVYNDYITLRRLVPHDLVDADSLYSEEVERTAYYPPNVNSPTPLLWIPRDEAGISRQEIRDTSKVIPITDEGASFNEKNKIVWDADGTRPPIWSEKTYY